MAEWQPNGAVEQFEITSAYGKTILVRTKPDTSGAEVVRALGLPASQIALLLIGGSATISPEMARKIKSLFSNSILPAAIESGAAILDGTPPENMKLIGDCLEFLRRVPPLFAVAPEACVTYPGCASPALDPVPLDLNHSHFVLCPGNQWGVEWGTRYTIARALSETMPVVAIFTDGENSERELLACVRRGWPVLVVKGTGGLADRIAAAKVANADSSNLTAEMEEILKSPSLRVVPFDAKPEIWREAVEGRSGIDATLLQVWNDYRRWDCAASQYQGQFRKLQWIALCLGIGATLFAVLQPDWKAVLADQTKHTDPVQWAMHYTIIALPILASILFAFMNHFRPGSRWLLLRGGAETIKREIYRYRARAGIYSNEQRGPHRATRLGQEVEKILKSLAQSEVNRAGESKVPPPDPAPPAKAKAAGKFARFRAWLKGSSSVPVKTETTTPVPKDEPLSALTGDRYVEVRLKDQISYYEGTTRKLDGSARFFQVLIFVAGGVGTFLAAIGLNVWVALSTAIVTAFTAKMAAEQQENSLVQYNQALAGLKSVLNWWTSLSLLEKKEQWNLDRLVAETESILQSEMTGWMQQMQTAIDRAQKPPDPGSGGKDKPPSSPASGPSGTPQAPTPPTPTLQAPLAPAPGKPTTNPPPPSKQPDS